MSSGVLTWYQGISLQIYKYYLLLLLRKAPRSLDLLLKFRVSDFDRFFFCRKVQIHHCTLKRTTIKKTFTIWKMSDRIVKWSEIWDSWEVAQHICDFSRKYDFQYASSSILKILLQRNFLQLLLLTLQLKLFFWNFQIKKKQEAQGLDVLLDKMEDNDHINWVTQRSRCIFHSKTCHFRETRFLKIRNTPHDPRMTSST